MAERDVIGGVAVEIELQTVAEDLAAHGPERSELHDLVIQLVEPTRRLGPGWAATNLTRPANGFAALSVEQRDQPLGL